MMLTSVCGREDTALASYHSFGLVSSLDVLGDFLRACLLPDHDMDSFAQNYLRWDSKKCNKEFLTNILCWCHLINQTLMYCNKIRNC